MSHGQLLALHGMMVLAGRPDRRTSSGLLKEALGASRQYLYKIMERLEQAGLVAGTAGFLGGFELARPSGEITLLEIFSAAGGNPFGHACLLAKRKCRGTPCGLGLLAEKLNREFLEYLAATRLSEFRGRLKIREAALGFREKN